MNRNPVSPERAQSIARMTEQEIFVAKVKLAGCVLLVIVDLIVIAWRGIPP